MKKEDIIIKTSAIISSLFIVFSGFNVANILKIKKQDNETYNTQKLYSQILLDKKSFNADLDIVQNIQNEGYSRLKMSEIKPVLVQYQDSMGTREKELIIKVVNYYNKIFSTINENYKFKIINQNEKTDEYDTLIQFENKSNLIYKNTNVSGSVNKQTKNYQNDEGNLIESAKILLDWEELKEYDDFLIYTLILHEFTHVLGFDDVYHKGNLKVTNTIDLTTFMNSENSKDIDMLYPNDYAILQTLYSNEYKKHENYKDAIKVVNKKIEAYTKHFYQTFSEILKEKCDCHNITQDLTKINITCKNNDKIYNIELKENNACILTIKNNEGKIIDSVQGEIMLVNGLLFIRNITIENANNYSDKFTKEQSLKLMICLYNNKNNELIINDGLSINSSKQETKRK